MAVTPAYHSALIVGAGPGLSASLARLFAREGMRVALAARNADKLAPLAAETRAHAFACDATDAAQVTKLFQDESARSARLMSWSTTPAGRGPVAELAPDDVQRAIQVSAFGGFLVAQEAAKRMLPNSHGAILLTGASASVRATSCRHPSRWASSRCAARPRAWPASWRPRASTSRTS